MQNGRLLRFFVLGAMHRRSTQPCRHLLAHPAQLSGPLTAAIGASGGSATDQSPSDQHAAGRLPTCVDMSVASKQVAVVGDRTAQTWSTQHQLLLVRFCRSECLTTVPIFCQGCSRPGDPDPLSLSDCGQVRSLPLSAEGHLGSLSLDLAGSSNQVAVGENRGIRDPVSRSVRHRDTGPCTSLGQCAHQVPAAAAVSPPFWGASCEIPFVPVDSPNFNAGIAESPVCRDLHDFSATVPDHLARRVQRKCLHSRGRPYMTHLQVRARLTNSFIELLEQLTFRWSMLYHDLARSV